MGSEILTEKKSMKATAPSSLTIIASNRKKKDERTSGKLDIKPNTRLPITNRAYCSTPFKQPPKPTKEC